DAEGDVVRDVIFKTGADHEGELGGVAVDLFVEDGIFAVVELEEGNAGADEGVGDPAAVGEWVADAEVGSEAQDGVLKDGAETGPLDFAFVGVEIELEAEVFVDVRADAEAPAVLHIPGFVESCAAELEVRAEFFRVLRAQAAGAGEQRKCTQGGGKNSRKA